MIEASEARERDQRSEDSFDLRMEDLRVRGDEREKLDTYEIDGGIKQGDEVRHY